MTVSLGGIDVPVFTGGVGESAAEVREHTASRLAPLGVGLDPTINANACPDVDISADSSNARTLVVAAQEALEIAAAVEQALGVDPG